MSVGDKLVVGDILGPFDVEGDSLGIFVIEMLGELLSINANFANGYLVGT